MEFDTKFIQLTSLGPSIYRLIENLNLLRFGLWLSSVRTEVSLIRSKKEFWNFSNFCRLSECYSLFVQTVGCLDVSIGRPDVQVVLFFLSFSTTPISSQSNTQAGSYDKNTETCAEILLETWKAFGLCCPSVWTVAVSWSVSEHEIHLQVEIREAWPSIRA
jgi:hypothetical protein